MIEILKKGVIPKDQKIYPEYLFESHNKLEQDKTRVSSKLSSLVVIYRKNKKYLIPFTCQLTDVCITNPSDIKLMTIKQQSELLDEFIDRSTQIFEFFSIDDLNDPNYIQAYKYE